MSRHKKKQKAGPEHLPHLPPTGPEVISHNLDDMSDMVRPEPAASEGFDLAATDQEVNLSPLGDAQAGFGEFYNDEWDMDQNVMDDVIRPRNASPTKEVAPDRPGKSSDTASSQKRGNG